MITKLRRLWQQAFGDSDDFLDVFFRTAYDTERSSSILFQGKLAAALYWFDCSCDGRKLAYIYAVATDEQFRHQGMCRVLMEKTHAYLRTLGYDGCVLVPCEESLFGLYEKLGYRVCGYVDEITCTAAQPQPLRPIHRDEYAALRRQYLPEGGVVQEGVTLEFLSNFAEFWAGDGCVLAATVEKGIAQVHELLGSAEPAGVIAALGARRGTVRIPGTQRPFAMYHPLTDAPTPRYLGLALD